MRAPDMPECFTLLGALASVTKTIELGPLVVNVGNRHPAILANSVATMQQISCGRFVLGLGAGSSPNSPFASERKAVGWIPPTKMKDRHAVVIEALDVMNEMWSSNRRAELAAFPMPNPRPNVIIGANSVALATIAGERTNGVNVKTVEVVVPSPAMSFVLVAACASSCAPMFSNGSSRVMSLATVTPSCVTVGAPNFLSSARG